MEGKIGLSGRFKVPSAYSPFVRRTHPSVIARRVLPWVGCRPVATCHSPTSRIAFPPHDHQGNPSHPVRCNIASSTLLGIGLRMILTSTTNPIDGS